MAEVNNLNVSGSAAAAASSSSSSADTIPFAPKPPKHLKLGPLGASSQEQLTLKDYLSIIRYSRAYGLFYGVIIVVSLIALVLSAAIPLPHPLWLITLEGILTALFVLEVALQIAVQRMNYFRSNFFNRLEFFMCILSVVAYVEILEKLNEEEYEWLDVVIIIVRYVARGGRLLFFIRHRVWHNPTHVPVADLTDIVAVTPPHPSTVSGGTRVLGGGVGNFRRPAASSNGALASSGNGGVPNSRSSDRAELCLNDMHGLSHHNRPVSPVRLGKLPDNIDADLYFMPEDSRIDSEPDER